MSNIIAGNNFIAAATGGALVLTVNRYTAGTELLQISPAMIVARYIIEALETMTDPSDDDSWPLYIGSSPDGDNVETNIGVMYDTVGIKDGRLMVGSVIQHFGIQLRIRSRDYEDGYEKIESVASDLDAILYETIEINTEEYRIENLSRTSAIIALGLEQNTTKRRFLFTVNFLATLKEISA